MMSNAPRNRESSAPRSIDRKSAKRPGGVQVRRLGNRQTRHFGQLVDENVVLDEVAPEFMVRERTVPQLRDERMVRRIGP